MSNLERKLKRRAARQQKEEQKREDKMEASKPESQRSEDAAEAALADSLQAVRSRIIKGITSLKVLHRNSKGRGEVPLDEVINLFDSTWKLVEFLMLTLTQAGTETRTMSLACVHKLQSLCKALKDKGAVSQEEIEKANDEILEEAQKMAEEAAATEFDEIVSAKDDLEISQVPDAETPSALANEQKRIIEMPK